MFEQRVLVRDAFDGKLECRLISMERDTQTRDGDKVLEIIAKLPADRVSVKTTVGNGRGS